MSRKNRTWKRAAMVSLASFVIAGSLAAETTLRSLHLEPSDTSVVFELGTTFHQVHGTMQVLEGELEFDFSTGTVSGRVVVDATSAVTGNKKRDRKMHEQVLESARYPDILFLPSEYKGELHRDGLSEIEIFGVMEIHGSTHEVQVPAEVHVSGESITGTAVFTVPYIEWGMKDPSMLFFRVEKELEIRLSFSGVTSGTDVSREPPQNR